MDLISLNETCYYFAGAVNIGYVQQGDQGMLIDTGIDDSVMRKVWRQLRERELPVTHLFITHAHADHFGGANFLEKRQHVHTIAPIFEAAILENPALEPLYLFGGNDPLPELTNKFIQGKPMRVDSVIKAGEHVVDNFSFQTYALPGHSYQQQALKIDGVLYAGDSYFGAEQLEKHKIPYITDADATIHSLQELLHIICQGAVPGHGKYEENFKDTVQINIDYHEKLLEWAKEEVYSQVEGISHEQLITTMCNQFDVQSHQLSQWLLHRTAVTAYLVGLIKRGEINHEIKGNRWLFKR